MTNTVHIMSHSSEDRWSVRLTTMTQRLPHMLTGKSLESSPKHQLLYLKH